MSKDNSMYWLVAFVLVISVTLVAADVITDDIHLNLQITNSTGSIETGTFGFVFNISNSPNCEVGNVVYSNSTNLTTDTRGILSYY